MTPVCLIYYFYVSWIFLYTKQTVKTLWVYSWTKRVKSSSGVSIYELKLVCLVSCSHLLHSILVTRPLWWFHVLDYFYPVIFIHWRGGGAVPRTCLFRPVATGMYTEEEKLRNRTSCSFVEEKKVVSLRRTTRIILVNAKWSLWMFCA